MRNRNHPQRSQGQRGSMSVEAGLLLPLLLTLMLAFIDIGRFYWTQTVVSSAAAEAARVAVMGDAASADITGAATTRLVNGGVSAAPSITVGARTAGQPVSVTVRVGFDFLTLSALDPDVAGHRTVSATSVMVYQP